MTRYLILIKKKRRGLQVKMQKFSGMRGGGGMRMPITMASSNQGKSLRFIKIQNGPFSFVYRFLVWAKKRGISITATLYVNV